MEWIKPLNNKPMSRYNHFAPPQYDSLLFKDIGIGEKFRSGKNLVICIKTGELTYMEQRSKKQKTIYSTDGFRVLSVDKNN